MTISSKPAGPALLVLAAGIGSRFGGFKQIEPLGAAGEIIVDYAVFDAWRAGFTRVVFVIRPELEQPFRAHFDEKLRGRMDVRYVFQELHHLPAGFSVPPGRQKPWGTAHAIWCAREAVAGPFAAINADDFYGTRSYQVMGGFLRQTGPVSPSPEYAMVGFPVLRTLSPFGTVSRGICRLDPEGFLLGVTERLKVGLREGRPGFEEAAGDWQALTGEETVSMNMWGFTASLFGQLEDLLAGFLKRRGQELKSEFYIPEAVDELLAAGRCRVRVLPTTAQWFGMTYPEDRQAVKEAIAALTREGIYPHVLWD